MDIGRFDQSVQTEKEKYFSSMLINEIENENIDEVKRLLLFKNADPNLVLPNRGIAAMHVVAGHENEYFSVEVLELVLEDKIGDPNVRSDDGLTPVHVAAIWGRCAALELLLKFGGDPFLQDYKLSLNAEDLALKEHQWKTHAILATFSVLNDNNECSDYFLSDTCSTSGLNFNDGLSNEAILHGQNVISDHYLCDEVSLTEKNFQRMETQTPFHPCQTALPNESTQMHENPSGRDGEDLKSPDKIKKKKKFSDQFVESFTKLRSFFGRASFPKTSASPKSSEKKSSKMSI